jgi:hypothetical protein
MPAGLDALWQIGPLILFLASAILLTIAWRILYVLGSGHSWAIWAHVSYSLFTASLVWLMRQLP